MMTDPIADLLTRMRNAMKAKHSKTLVQYSKIKMSMLDVLKKRRFIDDAKMVKEGDFDRIEIHFNPEVNFDSKRVSKPGQRIYVKSDELKPILNGYGISVISTSKGIMTGQEARKQGLGGEYLCEVW